MQDQGQFFQIPMIISLVVSAAFFVAFIWATVRILQKAGYSGWHALWYFVPIVGIVMFFVFAFSEWPIRRKVAELERQVFGEMPQSTLSRRT
jgi:uncharacterized membrane protein YhaH (DUF805 family)